MRSYTYEFNRVIHRKPLKAFNSIFHDKWGPTQVLGHWGKSGILAPKAPNYGHVIQNVKLHIWYQMKSYSNVKAIWESIYTCFVNWDKSGKLGPNNPIMGINTQKFIQSVKFHISHQTKPYWSLKTICRLSYICFSIFGELEQVGEIGPKYPKSWTPIQRKSFIVLNSTFYIKWSCAHLKSIWGSIYTCSCVFVELVQVREIWHKNPKSSKVLNSTCYI